MSEFENFDPFEDSDSQNSKNIRKRKLKQDDYTYKNLYDANEDPPASQESVANSNVDDKINNFNYIIEGEAEPIK